MKERLTSFLFTLLSSSMLPLTRIGAKDGEVDVVGQEPSAVLQKAVDVGCASRARQERREDGGKDTAHSTTGLGRGSR